MKFLTLADWTGMVETELFAQTYKTYGLATVRYPVVEIRARVEPFDHQRGFSLRVLRANKPRSQRAAVHRQGFQGIHPTLAGQPRADQPVLSAIQRQTGAVGFPGQCSCRHRATLAESRSIRSIPHSSICSHEEKSRFILFPVLRYRRQPQGCCPARLGRVAPADIFFVVSAKRDGRHGSRVKVM